VRDSKHPAGPVLTFSVEQGQAFVADVKASSPPPSKHGPQCHSPWQDVTVTRSRRWAIFVVGGIAALGSALAAVLFGVRGIEVASWLAGVSSFVVAVATLVTALPAGGDAEHESKPEAGSSVQAAGERSIAVGGDVSGIASTGNNSTLVQER